MPLHGPCLLADTWMHIRKPRSTTGPAERRLQGRAVSPVVAAYRGRTVGEATYSVTAL